MAASVIHPLKGDIYLIEFYSSYRSLCLGGFRFMSKRINLMFTHTLLWNAKNMHPERCVRFGKSFLPNTFEDISIYLESEHNIHKMFFFFPSSSPEPGYVSRLKESKSCNEKE